MIFLSVLIANLVHGCDLGGKVVSSHTELAHDDVTGCGETETVNSDDLGGVLVPDVGNTGFDSDTLGAAGRKDRLLVVSRLFVVNRSTWHGDNTGTWHISGDLKSMLDLRSGGNDDHVKVSRFLLGDVTSLEGSFTTGHEVKVDVLVKVLTGEDKSGWSILTGDGVGHGGDGLLGISWAVDIKVGDNTKTGNGLNRLMGRTILTNSDRVVGKDVRNSSELGKGSNTDSRTEVIDEDKESRSRSLEKSVVCESVKDGSHGMLTDSEVKVSSGIGLVESSTPVSTSFDVVTARSVQIGGSRDIVWDGLSNLLDDVLSGDTGGLGGGDTHISDGRAHLGSGWDLVVDSVIELGGESWVGSLPSGEISLPFIVDSLVLSLDVLEEVTGSLRDKPLLSGRKADVLLGLLNIWDSSLSVSGVGSFSLLHTLSDDGVALDELWLSVVGCLGSSDGSLDNIKVVTINVVSLPSVSIVTLDDVLGLSVLSHLVEGDLVGIVKDDQVIELLVSSEASGLRGDTLLEATISGKSVDVVVEESVFLSVVDGGSHLGGSGHTNSVSNTLSKRTSGGLNTRGGVLGVRELRVTRGHGVMLTEVLDFLNWQIKSGKVQPRVKKHGSVSSGKDEAITVDPLWVVRVVRHL